MGKIRMFEDFVPVGFGTNNLTSFAASGRNINTGYNMDAFVGPALEETCNKVAEQAYAYEANDNPEHTAEGYIKEAKDLINKKTILFFHGNAGELSNRNYKLNEFSKMDVNFLIIAWRGFSGNEGKPTEKGLYQDANSAIDWLKSKGVKEEQLILYGESLGTGVATEVAQNKNLAGIILESPYTSMTELAGKYYPLLPVKFLLKDRYESIKKIKNIRSPILIMHGGLDPIVPFQMGVQLYEAANEPKFKYFITNDDHMMRYDQNLTQQLKAFIEFGS